MIGMGGAKFQPDTEMSRAMLVTVLYRIAGSPPSKGTAPFRDVEKNSWYTNAVIWAYQNNVTNGVSATGLLRRKMSPVSRWSRFLRAMPSLPVSTPRQRAI